MSWPGDPGSYNCLRCWDTGRRVIGVTVPNGTATYTDCEFCNKSKEIKEQQMQQDLKKMVAELTERIGKLEGEKKEDYDKKEDSDKGMRLDLAIDQEVVEPCDAILCYSDWYGSPRLLKEGRLNDDGDTLIITGNESLWTELQRWQVVMKWNTEINSWEKV